MSAEVTHPLPSMVRGMFTHGRRDAIVDVFRIVAAVIIATALCWVAVRSWQPIFGIIGALITAQPLVRDSLGRALERALVVVVGVAAAFAAATILGARPWNGAVAVIAVLVVTWAAGLGTAAATQAAVIVILIVGPTATDVSLAGMRLVETVIGAAVGIGVTILAQPLTVRSSERVLQTFARQLADALDELANSIGAGGPDSADLERLRSLRTTVLRGRVAIERSRSSLDFAYPSRRRRDQVIQEERTFAHLERLAIEITGLVRTLVDTPTDSSAMRVAPHTVTGMALALRATLTGTNPTVPMTDPAERDAISIDLARIESEIRGLAVTLGTRSQRGPR